MKPDGFDVLSFVLAEVTRQHPSFTAQHARELLPRLHSALGGDSYYIPQRAPALLAERNDALRRDATEAAASKRELQTRHGVSRTTLYRLLKERR